MKKIEFALLVLAFSSCLLGPGQLSVAHAQNSLMPDLGGVPPAPNLTNDPCTPPRNPTADSIADSIKDGSAELFAHRYAVGHTTQLLDVVGTQGEHRPVTVHLWYPARGFEECENAGNSDGPGGDQACTATPSVYTSRLHGIPLLPQWDALSWTIGSIESFENLPISEAHRSFPVIVFSHGNQNNGIDYVYTLESLASFGFIVAAPDHVNNTQDDVRIDFVNSKANSTVIPCFDGLPSPCAHTSVPESLIDRFHDISAVIDALPNWFGDRADVSRVGVMGHSRGTVTALAAAGGSTTWGFKADPRVKAIMGLAIGASNITFAANVKSVTVPALLIAGTADRTAPSTISQQACETLGSTEKAFFLISNAEHRHFDSGLCAQAQSSGAVAAANPTRAILDFQTIRTLVSKAATPTSGVAQNFCGFETFTNPIDITSLVASLSGGFNVTPDDVPTDGLTSDEVKEEVVNLAVIFFGHVLNRDADDDRPFTNFLPPSVPDQDPTLAGCNLLTQVP